MNQATAVETTDYKDFATSPHPYLKAIVDRLRCELFSAARALRGDLLDAFWQSIDEINALRENPAASPRASPSDAVPQRLVALDSEYQKALLMRLRIDMLSVARALRGDLLDMFWRALDELSALRPS